MADHGLCHPNGRTCGIASATRSLDQNYLRECKPHNTHLMHLDSGTGSGPWLLLELMHTDYQLPRSKQRPPEAGQGLDGRPDIKSCDYAVKSVLGGPGHSRNLRRVNTATPNVAICKLPKPRTIA